MTSLLFARGTLRAFWPFASRRRSALRLAHVLAATLFMSCIGARLAQSGTADSWLGGTGFWLDPNWSDMRPPGYPDNRFSPGTTYDAIITAPSSNVLLITGIAIDSLTVGTGDTVEALSGGGLGITGTALNAGTIVLATGSSGSFGTGISGGGSVKINAGSDLTANHIIQSELAISGTATSPATVKIAPSDSSGNPPATSTARSRRFGLLGLVTAGDPFGAGATSSFGPIIATGSSPSGGVSFVSLPSLALDRFTTDGLPAAVPEPSTLMLSGLAGLGFALAALRRRPKAK